MAAGVKIWMPFHIGDYLAETMGLTTRQHGAYVLLLLALWQQDGAMPDSDATLAAICRLSLPEWTEDRKALEPLFKVKNGKWRHARIESELIKAQRNWHRRQAAGHVAAKARWEKEAANRMRNASESQPDGNANAIHPDAPSPSPSPLPLSQVAGNSDSSGLQTGLQGKRFAFVTRRSVPPLRPIGEIVERLGKK